MLMTSSWKCLENVSEMSRKCLNHSATMLPNASLANARAEGSVTPKANQNSVCLLLNRGPQSKPRLCLFAMGKSGGTSCPNDRAERYRSMQSRYRTRQTKIYLFAMGKSGGTSCFQSRYPKVNPERPSTLPIGSPKVNQDFVCLILGERRYMSPNDAKHQSLRPCYRTLRHRSLRPYCRTRRASCSVYPSVIPEI